MIRFAGYDDGAAYDLQRGRAPESAEWGGQVQSQLRDANPSTGPRSGERGVAAHLALMAGPGIPSTGPRSGERGVSEISFHNYQQYNLQRGRAPESAE